MSYTNGCYYYSISDLFDELLSSAFDGCSVPNKTKDVLVRSNLKYDIILNKKDDTVTSVTFGFAVPRRTKDDITVKYTNNYFTVKFNEIKADEDSEYRVKGISTKEDEAVFYVDTEKFDISKSKVVVKVENGYLTITVPVKKDLVENVSYDIK